MNNDKTALIKRVMENKALDSFLKLLVPFVIAAVAGLTGWMWNTSIKIVTLQETMDQESTQWQTIKENADHMIELRVRLGILEFVSGIDSQIEREDRQPFDLNDMFRKVDEEMENRKNEGVDHWKMMQQQSK